MRIAVISDIHGNLEAFERVLEDAAREKVDRIISLGDNVSYGADSEAVIQRMKSENVISVLGNHDWACVNEKVNRWYVKDVKKAIDTAMASLSSASFDYLKQLKLSLSFKGAWFVHGFPPNSVRRYLHEVGTEELITAFNQLTTNLCFIGHTHKLRLVYKQDQDIRIEPMNPGMIQLDRDRKYLINAGSVGQPRDGDPRAKYLIWEPGSARLDVRFVSYENHRAARKIIDAGLPFRFALAVDREIKP